MTFRAAQGYAKALQNYYEDNTVLRQCHQYSSAVREHITHKLLQEASLHLHLVLSEALLRRLVGSAPVMVDQLIWLMELTQQPNIEIQVIPDSAGQLATANSFSIMTFREDRFDDVIYVENSHGTTWLEDKDTQAPYLTIFDRLTESAEPTEGSVERIAEAVHTLQGITTEEKAVLGSAMVEARASQSRPTATA